MSEPVVIPIAHDFLCPWCWVGLFQAKRLKAEYGVELAWRGHELMPEELPWPEPRPADPIPANKPPILSRFEFLKLMDGIDVPQVERPKRMRIHSALEAVEFFKQHLPKQTDAFVEDIYHAYWERGERVGDVEVLERLAEPYKVHREDFANSIESKRYKDQIIGFNAPSYHAGVFNVPTFWIGGERYAEQPYVILEKAMKEAVNGVVVRMTAGTVYSDLSFPPPPEDRPYTFINMVATIDGKILSGNRDEPVIDLGSEIDHQFMKRIEAAADACVLGAQTLRAAKKSWSPQTETRVVITRSGDLPFDSKFFTRKPIIATEGSGGLGHPDIESMTFSGLSDLLKKLRDRGIQNLLCLGGSTLNAQLFERGLIDEIFLTIAPKIKLGQEIPTIADGNPLPRENIQNYSIVELHPIESEIFIRYRRNT